MRDSVAVLKELYGRPDFANSLIFAPEKHYNIILKEGRRVLQRAYSDMYTAQWWWGIQVRDIVCVARSSAHDSLAGGD